MRRATIGIVLVACRPAATATPQPQAPTPAATPIEVGAPLEVPRRINREYEGKHAEDWDARFEREGREVFDRRADILELLALRPGMDVADVGAGSGLFTLAMAEAIAPTGKAYAVDVQAYFLASIAAKARTAELANVVTVTADQRSSGLAADSIDLALFVDSYHHLEHPAAYLADIRRALRAGGRLVVIDYDRTGEHARWMKDHVRADPGDFLREIEAAGFRLRERPALLRENFVFVLEES